MALGGSMRDYFDMIGMLIMTREIADASIVAGLVPLWV